MTQDKSEFTDKQKAFLSALPKCEGDLDKAKKEVGYSDHTPLSQVIKPLKNEIIDICTSILAANAPRATLKLIHAMDNPKELGLQHKIKAILEILDRVGIVKEDKVHVSNNDGGIFFLPVKKVNVESEEDANKTVENSQST